MAVQPKYTVEDFEAFTELPENAERVFEFINGEIVEKMPTNALASKIAFWIGYLILKFLQNNEIEGHVTGADGGFMIGAERYAPDVAYLPAAKQKELEGEGYNSVPPDLAVEVETNTTKETERRLRKKIVACLTNDIVVWVVYPEIEEIEVYHPDGTILKLGIEDTLTGGKVLPGFTVAVKDIFAVVKK